MTKVKTLKTTLNQLEIWFSDLFRNLAFYLGQLDQLIIRNLKKRRMIIN